VGNANWDVPHGVTSALTLPKVLEFEAERQPLAEYGIEGTDVPWIVEYALGKRDDVEQLTLELLEDVE